MHQIFEALKINVNYCELIHYDAIMRRNKKPSSPSTIASSLSEAINITMGNHINGHKYRNKKSSSPSISKIRLLVLGYIRAYIELRSSIFIPHLVFTICSKYYGASLINCIFQCKIDRYGYLISLEDANKYNEAQHRHRLRNDSMKLTEWKHYLFTSYSSSQYIEWDIILNTPKLRSLIHKNGIPEPFRPLLWKALLNIGRFGHIYHTLINASQSPFHEEIWKDINLSNKNHTRFGLYSYSKAINNITANNDDLYQNIDDIKYIKRRKRYRDQRQKLSHCTRSAITLSKPYYLRQKQRRGVSVDNLINVNHRRKYCVTFFKHKVIDTDSVNRCGMNNVNVKQLQKHATKTQKQLYNVLKAFSLYQKDIGYTSDSGLSVIAGLLLLYMNECEVFCFLNALCDVNAKYKMLDLWKPTMPAMKLRLFELEMLIEKHLSKLWNHFCSFRMISALMFYAQKWFKTLFTKSNVAIISMDILFRIWDCYFNDGFVILFRFAVGILKWHQQKLLKTNNIDDVMDILQNECNVMNDDVFVKMCLSIKITEASLDKLQTF